MSNPMFYTLTDRESLFWNHQNPDMALWWKRKIFDRVTEEARERGFESVWIFDADETYLAICTLDDPELSDSAPG